MKTFLQIVLFALVTLTANASNAADVTINGVKQAAVVDVRTPDEFAAGHIDGAINIPLEQIQNGSAHLENLKKDSPILLYCRSGRRSGLAQQLLEQQGYSKLTNGGGVNTLAKQLNLCNASIC